MSLMFHPRCRRCGHTTGMMTLWLKPSVMWDGDKMREINKSVDDMTTENCPVCAKRRERKKEYDDSNFRL